MPIPLTLLEFREIEAELSQFRYGEIPVGRTLNDPKVPFMENREATLDESLAAADVVIVRGSGVGSDTSIKRRPVVVLNPGSGTVGHDENLVQLAGCPRARSAEELSGILRRVFHDPTFREGLRGSAERYIAGFCAAFGQDSARLIAQTVRQMAERPVKSG